jgi:signal transduction histidine kinase
MQFGKIFNIGIFEDTDPQEARYIRFTNMFSVMVVVSNLIISSILYSIYGPTLITIVIFLLMFVFGAVLLFSSLKLYFFGRFLLSAMVPIGIMVISYISKTTSPELLTSYSYFDTRTVLLGVLVIPAIVFPVKQKAYLLLGTILPGIFILFYNPIHDFIGIGYEQLLGKPEFGYQMSGVYYSITYIFLVTGLLIFKFSNEKLVTKNLSLLEGLKSTNKKLTKASETIQEQSEILVATNKELTELVDRRTIDLNKSNQELIKHNLELQQFSNTISHNLRGPVANLLGLSELIDLEKNEKEKSDLINHIRTSAKSLDEVLKDLGKIIDIRNHLFHIKENVKFSEVLEKVSAVLKTQIESCEAQITTDFKHDNLYCVRSYLYSIIYNLVSNSLKYRSPKKKCVINLKSELIDGKIEFSVEDNGIGIDMENHGQNLFGMYKRFHGHIDGKGLGLFLTKQQIDALGGKVDVESTPGNGAIFKISCPKAKEEIISEQVFYESDVAVIWFDAVTFTSTTVWKRKPTSDEYKEVLSQNLEVFRTYKCKGCLVDVRKLGHVNAQDRTWFVNNILNDAPEFGIEKFIVVHDRSDGNQNAYYEEMRKAVESLGIFFDHDSFEFDEAKRIIRNIEIN